MNLVSTINTSFITDVVRHYYRFDLLLIMHYWFKIIW